MKSCANCLLCYADLDNDKYLCMKGIRKPISDLFILGRVHCDEYVEFRVDISRKEKND